MSATEHDVWFVYNLLIYSSILWDMMKTKKAKSFEKLIRLYFAAVYDVFQNLSGFSQELTQDLSSLVQDLSKSCQVLRVD